MTWDEASLKGVLEIGEVVGRGRTGLVHHASFKDKGEGEKETQKNVKCKIIPSFSLSHS